MQAKKKWLMEQYATDKLGFLLTTMWLCTFAFSFVGSTIFSVNVHGAGEFFPFRIFLPITFVLYLIRMVQQREHVWKESSKAAKACMVLIAVMLVHSAVSLPYALDFAWSFRRFFNLVFDLAFFFLMFRLCRQRQTLKMTMYVCWAAFIVLAVLGVWETLFGPIFHGDVKIQMVNFFGARMYSPMVTYRNTNDYMTAMIFMAVFLLIWWARTPQKKHWHTVFGTILILLYLVECAAARLLTLALWALIVTMLVYALKMRKVGLRTILVVALAVCMLTAGSIYSLMASEANKPDDPSIESDMQGGEIQIDGMSSAEARLKLMLHAFQCFYESKGMGVGIGNTEQLALEQAVAYEGKVYAIHCFVARVLGDYGLWAGIPLCYLAIQLLKYGVNVFRHGIMKNSKEEKAFAVLYSVIVAVYVLLSTTPAEAQDILPMWMYLSALVLLPNADQWKWEPATAHDKTHGKKRSRKHGRNRS